MAPKANDTVEVAIALDKQSAAEYARQVGASQSLMEGFAQSVERAGGAAYKAGDKITEAFANARKRGAELAAEAKALPLEIKKIADETERLNTVQTKGGDNSRAFGKASRAASQLGLPGAEFLQAADDISDLTESLGAMDSGVIGLVKSLGPVAIIVGGIALAFSALTDGFKKDKDQVEQAEKVLDSYYAAIKRGTTQTLKDQITDVETDIKLLKQKREEQLAEHAKVKADIEKKFPTANPFAGVGLGIDVSGVAKVLDVAAGKTKAWADEIAKTDKEIADSEAALKGLSKAINSNEVAANDAAIAAGKLQQEFYGSIVNGVMGGIKNIGEEFAEAVKLSEERAKNMAGIQKKYNDDVESIEDRSLKARGDLAQKFADAQIAIAEKAVEASEAALSKLLLDQEKIGIDFDRAAEQSQRKATFDDLTVQIKSREEETKALRSHLRDLETIRDAGRRNEREFLLNRNFLGLYLSQQKTADDLTDSNKKFVQSQQDSIDAQKQQVDETKRQREFERQERLIAFNLRIEDTNDQYRRELRLIEASRVKQLQVAQTAYNKDLTALINKTNDELRIKYNGYVAELTLASKTAAERVLIQQKTDAALLNSAYNTLGKVQALSQQPYTSTGSRNVTAGTPVLRQFAQGGFAQAGVPIEVNERGSSGNESFGALRFPGHGVFMPFRSGNVDPGKSNTSVSATFNIFEATNPDKVGQVVNQKIMRLIS